MKESTRRLFEVEDPTEIAAGIASLSPDRFVATVKALKTILAPRLQALFMSAWMGVDAGSFGGLASLFGKKG